MADLAPSDRTDDVPQKLRLLEQAFVARNFDLAMSLAESLKDSLQRGRQRGTNPGQPQSGADHFLPVEQLPAAWAKWAGGWSFCKPVTLFETVGVAREREPVELLLAFQPEQVTDLARELRVARVDPQTGLLQEVLSQVYGLAYYHEELFCHVVFPAQVALHERSTYLIFYGNPLAELPEYETDLRVRGAGYGLEIENRHFTAQLSSQMGQLERLTYKRDHGLELFAGGKGHGEPPGIDWSGDYVDEGNFQKLRLRNWESCPNYEVVRGPLCVRVRRWGFPHSPVHPLFAPSRLHWDQTYVFHAGLPYFVKEAQIEVVQDVAIDALRDEEWVFSGYSFTDQVWIDRHGKLRAGPVPDEEAQDLWGVGFYHRQSRDAFLSLWLEHTATGIEGLQHNAHPSLAYKSHGQLWSRYPLRKANLKAGSAIQLKNAYLTAAYPVEGAAPEIERLRHQLLHPLEVGAADLAPFAGANAKAAAKASGSLARPGETAQTAPQKPALWRALDQVRDEQLYTTEASIVDLGYVYDVRVRNGVAHVLVTMPHRGRPVYEFLVSQGGGRVKEGIREHLLRVPGIEEVVVDVTWEPAWSSARLNAAGRKALGF